jgi:hypothetical protein
MAAVPYKQYYLISRPHRDANNRRWSVYVSIIWNVLDYGEDKFEYHTFKEFKNTFETAAEAFSFGLRFGRAWVDGEANIPKEN